jgi:uncharacterized protein YciI
VVDDFVARLGAYRGEHLRRVSESYAHGGELIVGGALAVRADRALPVFHVADKKTVLSFIENDPDVVSGLVKKWEVRPWNVMTGNEAAPNSGVPKHPKEIVRAWSARTGEQNWLRYREHFAKRAKLPGYVSATLSVRAAGDQREILVETYWRSLGAVRAFAGVDLDSSVVPSETVAVLTEYEKRVRHYEIVLTGSATT